MRPLLVPLLALVAAAGCGASESARPDSFADMGAGAARCFGANDCAPGQICNQFGVCTAAQPSSNTDGGTAIDALPPEVVIRPEPPASGKRYVYVAISNQDTVARIDSTTLAVTTIPVGADPGVVRTAPGQDVAVVLSRGSATASILRARDDGTDDVSVLGTAPTLNQLAMSPDGTSAVAFFDVRRSGGVLSPRQTFQEVTLIHLDPGPDGDRSVSLSVGFRPSEVQFAADGSRAWVITEQGVSIIDIAATNAPAIVPTVPVLRDPLREQPALQVVVAAGGTLALARLPDAKLLRVVDLKTRAITDIPLPAAPSDIALAPDGKRAVVVLRDAGEVAIVDIPGDLADPTGIVRLPTQGWIAGQSAITADSRRAYLFTNATPQKVLLVADLAAQTLSTWPLKKGVRMVVPSPDGRTALVIHNKAPGQALPSDPLDDYLDKRQGYSVFDASTGFVKLALVDAPPGELAFAPDSGAAFLLLDDRTVGVRSVEAINLASFLVTSVRLGSPPVAVGVVHATRQVFVAQEHPLGRMTFIDTATWKTRTLTGYGLNSQIIE